MSTHLSEPPVEAASFVELLRWRAAAQPERRAYTFLLDGESDEACLTHAELDRQARMIAARLQALGAAGGRALLLYQPGLDYIAAFFGCLYAGVVAVPAYPPDPYRLERSLPRFQAIMADARPVAALTTATILSMVEPILAELPDLRAPHWLSTDDLPGELAAEWQAPAVDRSSLAFLQYTSGSTATPKGVMITHGNLLHNSAQIYRCFGHTPETRAVIWLPPYHDMGLIGGILQPLYAGFPVTLMSPFDFLQRPLRWLRAISRYQANTSGGPNFAYELCLRKINAEQRATLDLSSWDLAFNGAEPIRAETLERFAAAFAPCGFRAEAFYPCYGLAEATLIVSGGHKTAAPVTRTIQAGALQRGEALAAPAGEADIRTLVGCGQAVGDQQVRIVDPETSAVCPPGQVGEIWVAGPSVAQGYWGRPAETEQTFRATVAGDPQTHFLRTGDLGFVQDGELFITGRRKDLIIIEGRNHYPQDIELTVERCHPALRPGCCAAITANGDGPEQLVVVAEVERQYQPATLDGEELARLIRRAVAEQHDIRVHSVVLLKAGSIPKTSSGKIQRHACRAGFLAGALEVWGA